MQRASRPCLPFLPCARVCIFWQIIAAALEKKVTGATLISMVNSDRLGELGITRLKRTQLLWHLEVRFCSMYAGVEFQVGRGCWGELRGEMHEGEGEVGARVGVATRALMLFTDDRVHAARGV